MARFYFAFVDSTDKTFLNTFKRNDADVFSFDLVHEEGQFARLDVELKNPKVSLLAPNRKQWCWLSYENGQTFSTLFFGRMVGTPSDIEKEIIKVTFVAKPTDFDSQKEALAETLRTLPNYDPVWISPNQRLNAESVLESRPLLWHIDRKSHVVTASNINSGEDGVINIGPDFYYESLKLSYGSPPLSKINIEGSVSWTENVSGILDIASSFPNPLRTLSGDGLITTWPEYGTDLGGNWKVDATTLTQLDGYILPTSYYIFNLPGSNSTYGFPISSYLINEFKVKYGAARKRTESIKFTVNADVQEIFADNGNEIVENLSFSSTEIDKPIDNNNTPLIPGITRTYFKTDRGKQSLEYLLAVAKTKFLSRARAVVISGETEFENGLNFSCRKDISIEDDRIGVGAAIGKITSYSLYCKGDSGQLGAKFTIGCTIGRGASTVVSSGSPSYAEGYVSGYQYYSGAQFEAAIGDITYEDYSNQSINDDGFDFQNFTKNEALNSLIILNPYSVQITNLKNGVYAQQNVDVLKVYFTQIILTMNSISNGPFVTNYNVSVSDFTIPKTIDLEA